MPTPRTKPFRPAMLSLEVRLMLDASATPDPTPEVPDLPANATAITPAELASYYQTDQIAIKPEDGTSTVELGKGETVALIEEDYDPKYVDSADSSWSSSTLALYSRAMGLPSNAAGTNADFTFTMVDDKGSTDLAAETGTGKGQLTATSQNSGEFALDIQAVHAIAPYANIVVVIVPNLTHDSIKAGIAEALKHTPAVISMSFSGPEHGPTSDASYVDQNGVTYVMSSGDDGAGEQYTGVKPRTTDDDAAALDARVQADVVEARAARSGHKSSHKHHGRSSTTATSSAAGANINYVSTYKPLASVSQNEVMVGGTTMKTANGAVTGEIAWGHGEFSFRIKVIPGNHGGGGGGYSNYNAQPDYQKNSPAVQAYEQNYLKQSVETRLGPDLSMMSQPGIELLRFGLTKAEIKAGSTAPDHYYWAADGGTSLAAPLFAGLMAIVAQGRTQEGLPQLSSPDTLNFLYQAPAADFNDITAGNNGYPALPGFDLATGLGTPTAALINDLITATYATTTTLTATTDEISTGPQTTLTADVAASPGTRMPVGSVDFYDGKTLLQSVRLGPDGEATYAFDPTVGTHQFTAKYAASGLFAASSGTTSAVVGGTTAAASTTTLQIQSSSVLAANEPVTLMATVAAAAGTTPTGSVSFTDDGQVVGTAAVVADGRASIVYTPAGPGVHSLVATYGGAMGVAGSSSRAGAVAIMATPTTTTLMTQPADDAESSRQYTLTTTVTAG